MVEGSLVLGCPDLLGFILDLDLGLFVSRVPSG
ncbi:hypothetical protein Sinac_7557 [Singulisphaera acidiphila DSM 18658]|uniref:Uncharacterized protein n=1 Tax=Singulisphaera acidiphila (strain ATCC BAA-1392 / DSM 18658 / VKM B-2454 / MOB10) TaxID=886293 RepID=L0DRG3_SINAD|nr:hypothetical protein Sinac_7557 [Singulisphaera acidiphila DSM 18658]